MISNTTLYAVWQAAPIMSPMPNITVLVNETVYVDFPTVTPSTNSTTLSSNTSVFDVETTSYGYAVTGRNPGTDYFTVSATIDGITVSQQCKVTVPTPSVTLSSYSGSSYQSTTGSNVWLIRSYSTSPGVIVSGGEFVGWRTPLPTVSYSNIAGWGASGWEVVSGNAVVSGDYLYIAQPGTVKIRYHERGYYSDVYTYTLSLYKITSATNYIRNNLSSSPTRVGSVPANTTVTINQVGYTGTMGEPGGQIWGKVTYNGVTGWIPLCGWT